MQECALSQLSTFRRTLVSALLGVLTQTMREGSGQERGTCECACECVHPCMCVEGTLKPSRKALLWTSAGLTACDIECFSQQVP